MHKLRRSVHKSCQSDDEHHKDERNQHDDDTHHHQTRGASTLSSEIPQPNPLSHHKSKVALDFFLHGLHDRPVLFQRLGEMRGVSAELGRHQGELLREFFLERARVLEDGWGGGDI